MSRLPGFNSGYASGTFRFKRGLSIIQLVGCIAAIAAGIFVGAAFLDIDLKAAWNLGLQSAGVAVPQEKPLPGEPENATQGSGPGSTGNGSAADLTLAYWNKLRDTIQEEQTARMKGPAGADGGPRAGLYVQMKAFRQAADAIRGLATEGVDAEATALADDLAAWYETAFELSDEGTRLEEADLAASSGPQGRRWHSAQKQLGEQSDLLSRKTKSVQGKLTSRYQKPFPDLR
jgi:hypothetical protein